jgi:hypothetical protein
VENVLEIAAHQNLSVSVNTKARTVPPAQTRQFPGFAQQPLPIDVSMWISSAPNRCSLPGTAVGSQVNRCRDQVLRQQRKKTAEGSTINSNVVARFRIVQGREYVSADDITVPVRAAGKCAQIWFTSWPVASRGARE